MAGVSSSSFRVRRDVYACSVNNNDKFLSTQNFIPHKLQNPAQTHITEQGGRGGGGDGIYLHPFPPNQNTAQISGTTNKEPSQTISLSSSSNLPKYHTKSFFLVPRILSPNSRLSSIRWGRKCKDKIQSVPKIDDQDIWTYVYSTCRNTCIMIMAYSYTTYDHSQSTTTSHQTL